MSVFTKMLCASAIAFACATPALAVEGSVWGFQTGMAYVVDMNGSTKMVQPKDPAMAAFKKHAKRVPRGTVFFMSGGELYMMHGTRSLFETNF